MKIEFEKIDKIDKTIYSKEEIVNVRKEYSKLENSFVTTEETKECILCKKKITSYCKSHTIPQFILKQIAEKGDLITGVTALGIPMLNVKYGVGNALVFRCICNQCDNTVFQAYEDPYKYKNKLNEEMIALIALKNNLRMFDKSKYNYNMLLKLYEKIPLPYYAARITVAKIDLRDYEELVLRKDKINYYVIDDLILPYMTPLAFQGVLNLLVDFDGNIINNLYNLSLTYRIQNLHVIVFPNNGSTHVCLFIKDGDTRYRSFYKKYRKLSLNEKLYALNYMILLNSEDWVLNPAFNDKIDDETSDLIRSTVTPEGETDDYNEYLKNMKLALEEACEKFKIKVKGNLYNFLSEENKLK